MHEFQNVIEQLIELFTQLIPLEENKLKAASLNKVTFVEDCMTKEQAMILRLKGLEKEREAAQERAGFGGLTFKEILEKVSDEEEKVLRPLFDQLNSQIKLFQEINSDAMSMIRTNIHQIQKAVKIKEEGGYTENGSMKPPEQHLTNRKV